jgi:hypothetical protein
VLFWWRPPCVLRPVLITPISDPDTGLRGVLWQSRGPWLVLRDAALLRPRADALPMDGEVLIHRANVAFIQVLPHADRE